MAEAKPDKPKRKPKKEAGPILAAASAAWIREQHHPRLSEDEACALMMRVFPRSRHACRATACPIQCPRHPDFGEPPPPPAWSTPIPPMTPEEVAAAERGLAPLRHRSSGESPPRDGLVRSPCVAAAPVLLDPAGAVAPTTPDPVVSVPAWSPPAPPREDPGRTLVAYPPCLGCGRRRTIMLVMAGTREHPPWTQCSFCARGEF